MGNFERKLLRNQLKAALKKNGQKRIMPLSKYRFKTQKEIQEEYATRMTENMIKTARETELKERNDAINND